MGVCLESSVSLGVPVLLSHMTFGMCFRIFQDFRKGSERVWECHTLAYGVPSTDCRVQSLESSFPLGVPMVCFQSVDSALFSIGERCSSFQR